ncbi:hypothetical protein [Sorangium sp. So ce1389]|uniref:hypothetical protein n=1 Tax=Sorangium sp. So ce1389 TaxID=3133336 RepID=UPI003F61B2A1
MAIWQCSFLLVPSTELGRDAALLLERMESGDLWAHAQPDEAIERAATDVLGRSPSWSPEVDIWGHDDTTCLTMIREGGRVVEVLLRIDLRSVQRADLVRLLDGLRRAGVLLVDETKQLHEPTLPAVLHALKMSRAWRYVEDPRAYIASLSDPEGRD